jgi:PPM family protein phosphatase
MNLTWAGRTHTCGRPKNEDSFATEQVNDHLAAFTVADGLGGLPAGEFSSRLAITAMMDTIRTMAPENEPCPPARMEEMLLAGFVAASRSIADDCLSNPEHKGMATTLVTALINDALDGVIAFAGDSRAYIAGNELIQITTDHSLVQELVTRGIITRDGARLHPDKNVVTRIVGEIPVEPDTKEFRLGNETLILCTDGLPDALSDEEIFHAVSGTDTERICTTLIERAVQVNRDNTTIIVIRAAPGS